MGNFSHFNEYGRARMVDVSQKEQTYRVARASGKIFLNPETYDKIEKKDVKKGDVLSVAQLAGIMAAKQTSSLIPMCHNLNLTAADIEFVTDRRNLSIEVIATVKTKSETGVEMEALQAVSTALLTIYDMCKAIQKDMIIGHIHLLEKSGGKSGHYLLKDDFKVVNVSISENKGTRKKPVPFIELKENHGIIGDAHAGDWHRQVSLLGEESVDAMRGALPNLGAGDFAENILTRGRKLYKLSIGTQLRIGEVLLEITQIGKECHGGCEIRRMTGDCVMPREGIFAVVKRGGKIFPNDSIMIMEGEGQA